MDDLASKIYPEDVIVRVEGVNVPVNLPPVLSKPVYQLLNAASLTGEFVAVVGGTYVWSVVAQNFNGATVTFQVIGPDSVTILDVIQATTNVSYGIYVGEGTLVRAAITDGPPVNVYSDLRAYLT